MKNCHVKSSKIFKFLTEFGLVRDNVMLYKHFILKVKFSENLETDNHFDKRFKFVPQSDL
jgi:hypothetical protein